MSIQTLRLSGVFLVAPNCGGSLTAFRAVVVGQMLVVLVTLETLD